MHFDMLQLEKGFVCSYRLANGTAALKYFSIHCYKHIISKSY